MKTLLLRLGGPLQSWGSDSKYDDRGTDAFPTKSGVIGMIAAAMGRYRDQEINDLASQLKIGVRIDNKGTVINDFQITDMVRYNANLSNKKYLSDALFLVGVEGPDALLKEIAEAMQQPQFPLFLGRRSCPPDRPVYIGIKENELYKALYDEKWLVPDWRKQKLSHVLRIIIESDDGVQKRDVPISYSPLRRNYTYRNIKEFPPRVIQNNISEHDAMSELR